MRVPSESGIPQGGSTVASSAPNADRYDLEAEQLAEALDRRGLAAPAAVLLDAHRPLLPLLRQGAIFLGPMLTPLISARRFASLRRTVDDPAAYERLAARLARGNPDPGTPEKARGPDAGEP